MSNYQPSVEFTGNWEGFKHWIAWMHSGGYLDNVQEHLKVTGNAVRNLLRGHILSQDMGWKPLHPMTIKQKEHGIVYKETDAYARRIRVTSLRRKYGATVGITPGTYVHTRSGKAAAEIAFINEYGGSKIPTRPIWRPVFMEMQALPEIAQIPLGDILEMDRWSL